MRLPHWQFFESIDDELYSLSRVIEFDTQNFSTFSVTLTRLYLSICSEINVVAKLLCARIAPSDAARNINDYRGLITGKFANFADLTVEMPSHELVFHPWKSWETGVNPSWWTSYNNVKHERSKYYSDANLRNVLESGAGLLVLLVYWHQPELYADNPTIQPDFKTMRIDRQFAHILRFGFDYSLPDFGKAPIIRKRT